MMIVPYAVLEREGGSRIGCTPSKNHKCTLISHYTNTLAQISQLTTSTGSQKSSLPTAHPGNKLAENRERSHTREGEGGD